MNSYLSRIIFRTIWSDGHNPVYSDSTQENSRWLLVMETPYVSYSVKRAVLSHNLISIAVQCRAMRCQVSVSHHFLETLQIDHKVPGGVQLLTLCCVTGVCDSAHSIRTLHTLLQYTWYRVIQIRNTYMSWYTFHFWFYSKSLIINSISTICLNLLYNQMRFQTGHVRGRFIVRVNREIDVNVDLLIDRL